MNVAGNSVFHISALHPRKNSHERISCLYKGYKTVLYIFKFQSGSTIMLLDIESDVKPLNLNTFSRHSRFFTRTKQLMVYFPTYKTYLNDIISDVNVLITYGAVFYLHIRIVQSTCSKTSVHARNIGKRRFYKLW